MNRYARRYPSIKRRKSCSASEKRWTYVAFGVDPVELFWM